MANQIKKARARAVVCGAVQGVGFRPFVYHLASQLLLSGSVRNDSRGVVIEVEGNHISVTEFLLRLERDKPPLAVIQSVESTYLQTIGLSGDFVIEESTVDPGSKTALILPDVATCPDCLRELLDPRNRRYRHAFINCTHCGPRFSIIEALPYDRPHTSMKKFAMCDACAREYRNPRDRRFHAQPTACPGCGPQLFGWDASGQTVARGYEAVEAAARELLQGRIVALKGIGGFQLLADARNEEAVRRLRLRKRREEKPLAVMVLDLDFACECGEVSLLERRILVSPQAPIVLLRRHTRNQKGGGIAPSVAPSNPYIGVMLPYSPLHHLLIREAGMPLVATSGNLTDEPICVDEYEALARLQGIADFFLVHDRPIVRYVDDSVARVILGREQILRRARGYAPLPVHLKEPLPAPVLALGAHQKNTVALGWGSEVFVSQHLGDLETEEANQAFRRMAEDLPRLYGTPPAVVVCDLHPEYLSTAYAARMHANTVAVQHHRAHVLACMAENELDPPVLGVAWDGTGLGEDGTIWGGEFLVEEGRSCRRVAHLQSFRLPGGEAAIREPRRCALGLLYETFGEGAFSLCSEFGLWKPGDAELPLLRTMLEKRVQAPVTTSAGRLFDGVAALIGLRSQVSFEGQAAMELEFALTPDVVEAFPFRLDDAMPMVLDWRPLVRAVLEDVRGGQATGVMAAKFHNSLALMVCAVAHRAGQEKVVLTGGCFQNRYLTERCARNLEEGGFRPVWHQRIPPNDGGISLGQVLGAMRTIQAAAGPAGAGKTSTQEQKTHVFGDPREGH